MGPGPLGPQTGSTKVLTEMRWVGTVGFECLAWGWDAVHRALGSTAPFGLFLLTCTRGGQQQ